MRLRLLAPLLALAVIVGLNPATAVPVPLLASSNVELVNTIPDTQAISGEFSQSSPHFYVSSLDSVSVFDISDPRAPRLTDTLPLAVFENESMTHGERPDGTKFVLVGDDLYSVPLTEPQKGKACCGGRVLVIDVSNPNDMKLRSIVPVKSSSHTVQCVTLTCEFAYTAGSGGQFSIVDLRDLDKPVQAKVANSPASAQGPEFAAGHFWDIDEAGIAWHTGSGGLAAFDITDPLNPVILNATGAQGTEDPWNNFLLHNSQRPNANAFQPTISPAEASVANGNVALVTEEDYDSPTCDADGSLEEGSFSTWYIPTLDAASYPQDASGLKPDAGTITPLDRYNTTVIGTDVRTPAGAFCSGHWFDFHQDGFVAQGFYQQGLRLLDVRDATDIKEIGYFYAGASEVWDAYWVPERDENGVATGEKTNLVYTADLIRGIDILEVDLGDAAEKAPPQQDEQPEEGDDATGCDARRRDGGRAADGHGHRHPGDREQPCRSTAINKR